MPNSLILQPATIVTNLGTLSSSVPVVDVVNSTYFTVFFELMRLNGEVMTAQYQAILIDKVRPNEVITQNVYTEYTSTPTGFKLPGRFHNSPATAWASNLITMTVKLPTIVTNVDRTDIVETSESPIVLLNVGEVVVYRTRVVFPETQSDAVIVVTLPTGIIFQSASVISIGSTIQNSDIPEGGNVGTANVQVVTFNFGTIDLVADNAVDDGDAIVVEVCYAVFSFYPSIQSYHLPKGVSLFIDSLQVIALSTNAASNFNNVSVIQTSTITTDLVNTRSASTSVTFLEPSLFVHEAEISPPAGAELDAGDVVRSFIFAGSFVTVIHRSRTRFSLTTHPSPIRQRMMFTSRLQSIASSISKQR